MKRAQHLTLAVPVTLFLLLFVASPASAQSGSHAACQVDGRATFDPGISEAPSRGRFSSTEPGGVTCTGRVAEAELAGRGTMSFEGTYGTGRQSGGHGDTCLLGSGRGTFRMVLPVVDVLGDSKLVLSGRFDFVRIGAIRTTTGVASVERWRRGPFDPGSQSWAEPPVSFATTGTVVKDGEDCADGAMTAARIIEAMTIRPGGTADDPAVASDPGTSNGACAHRQVGTRGRDKLVGGAGGDDLRGRGGNDLLKGRAGGDCLYGGRGRDVLSGGSGADSLTGGRGRDRFGGGSGADAIDSVDGRRERVRCGRGKDRVRADRIDRLTGCELVRRIGRAGRP